MIKSELIIAIAKKQVHLSPKEVELAVNAIIEHMTNELASGGRVEVRGFGSFSLRHYAARMGRNPRTGESVSLPPKYAVHFKVGLELRKRVRESESQYHISE